MTGRARKPWELVAYPYSVGRIDPPAGPVHAKTLEQAEAIIALLESVDPEGVHAGNYYIDGPEPGEES